MDKTIRELTEVLQMDKRGTKPYDTTAEVVRVEESTAWVHIPGGIDETPVQMTIDAKVGDVVQVRVSGGRAWITGNSSAPPTDDTIAKAARTKANSAEVIAVEASELSESAKTQAEAAARVAGNTSQHFWFTGTGADTGAHITEKTEEEFISDPSNGGGNLLARSNGVAVRDGLNELATMTATEITIGDTANQFMRVDATGGVQFGKNTLLVGEAKVDELINELTIRELTTKNCIILGQAGAFIGNDGIDGIKVDYDTYITNDLYIQNNKVADYVIQRGTSGNWKYIKWASGRVECEGYYTFSSLTFSQRGSSYRSPATAFTIPSGIFTNAPSEGHAWIQSGSASDYFGAVVGSLTTSGGNCMVWKATSGSGTNVSVHMRLIYR